MKLPSLSLLATCAVLFAPRAAPAAPGDLDPGFTPSVQNYVYFIAQQPDGKLITGAYIERRFYANGALDTDFTPGATDSVVCAVVQEDGKVVLGGTFHGLGGVTRNNIGRVNANGTLDASFNPNVVGSFTDVASMMIQPDGKIVFGGIFKNVGGVVRNYIARVNADGILDPDFNPKANDWVGSMAVQDDGKIIIGGNFTTIGGVMHNHLARLNADGTLDQDFNPTVNKWPHIALQADGKIIIGGNFTIVNGVARDHIARLNIDGTLDLGFAPSVGGSAYDGVGCLAVQADGKIILGGYFFTVAGLTRHHIARVNADGALDMGFNPDASSDVVSATVQADGKIVIGGSFAAVANVSRVFIARLQNDPATQILSVPSLDRLEWLRGGASPETHRVTFELSTNGGSTWTQLGAGTRIAGGWELAGLSLPNSGSIRARARIYCNGSSGLVESLAIYGVPTPIQQWKLTQLGDAFAPDLGDIDFDGLTNLAEYALNRSPTAPSRPPPVERHVYGEGERLRMFFTRDPVRNDVTIEAQAADSPADPWTTVAASTLGGVTIGVGYVGGEDASPGLKTVEVRDTMDISPTTTSRYLRVKVTH